MLYGYNTVISIGKIKIEAWKNNPLCRHSEIETLYVGVKVSQVGRSDSGGGCRTQSKVFFNPQGYPQSSLSFIFRKYKSKRVKGQINNPSLSNNGSSVQQSHKSVPFLSFSMNKRQMLIIQGVYVTLGWVCTLHYGEYARYIGVCTLH
jgi:hypothetical protein